MCRLFGFRSVITSRVHSSLVHAENALVNQSEKHPDGWGIAFYVDKSPHLIRSSKKAIGDKLFEQVSGVVSAQTVVAHIRKATQGSFNILNAHPFQYGKWIFAHNGNIKNFKKHKKELLKLVDSELSRFILGETDSEVIFFILLTEIQREHGLFDSAIPLEKIKVAIERGINQITEIIGPLLISNNPVPTENYLSFLLTDGDHFIGFHGGQPLNYCTHKTKCPERESCEFFDKICENAARPGDKINHLIITSEEIAGANVWNKLRPGQLVGIDHSMTFFKADLQVHFTKA